MTTLLRSSTTNNYNKSNGNCRQAAKSFSDSNRKCGEITFCTQMHKRVYTLNCLYCPQICLQLDMFIDHMEREHDENLIHNSMQMDGDEKELQMYDDNSEDLHEENQNTSFSKEPDESNQFVINEPLDDDNSTNASLSLECSIKREDMDCDDIAKQTIVDDNTDNIICKIEVHEDDEPDESNPFVINDPLNDDNLTNASLSLECSIKKEEMDYDDIAKQTIVDDNTDNIICKIGVHEDDEKSRKMSSKSKHRSSSDILSTLEAMQADLRTLKENINNNKKAEEENKKKIFDTIERQNNAVCEVLAEHSASFKVIISSFWNTPKYIKQFPIKTEEGLCQWEDDIKEDNKDEMVKTVTTIMGEKGLNKGLPLIISPKILLTYNLSGTHNKKGLKFFKNIMDVLFLSYTSSSMNASDPKSFEKQLRLAIKNIKNRHFKDLYIQKKDESKKM